ncbi:rCG61722 [Rattus norvegicus]|uniref:RCG61722 n=1 Tax=Rattus norvegicus TaxID=10116 RepID=A6HCD1_RAT|nr:rCG61722 [Rattus norvegicus]
MALPRHAFEVLLYMINLDTPMKAIAICRSARLTQSPLNPKTDPFASLNSLKEGTEEPYSPCPCTIWSPSWVSRPTLRVSLASLVKAL